MLLFKNNFKVKKCVIKFTAYADDLCGIVSDYSSIKRMLGSVVEWGMWAGAKINEQKTKILGLSTDHNFYKEIRFSEKIKLLGITFNEEGVDKVNIDNAMESMRSNIFYWSDINTSLIERVIISKIFILS